MVSEGRSNGRGEAASAGYFANILRKLHSVKMSGMSSEMPSLALISGMEKGESFAQLKWRLMCDDVGERWRSLRRLLATNGDSTKLCYGDVGITKWLQVERRSLRQTL